MICTTCQDGGMDADGGNCDDCFLHYHRIIRIPAVHQTPEEHAFLHPACPYESRLAVQGYRDGVSRHGKLVAGHYDPATDVVHHTIAWDDGEVEESGVSFSHSN